MTASTLLGLAVTVVVVTAGLLITIRGLRPPSGPASTLAGLTRYRAGRLDTAGTAITTALAISTMINPDNLTGAAVVGALTGISLIPLARLGVIGELFLGILGAAASLETLYATLGATGILPRVLTNAGGIAPVCGTRPLTDALIIIVAATVFTAAAAIGLSAGHRRLHASLALFGLLDVLLFITNPAGTPLAANGPAPVLTALAVAALGGVATVLLPDLTLALAGVGIGLALLVVGVTPGLAGPCTTSIANLTAVAATLTGWVITRKILKAITTPTSRRSRR